MRASGFPRVLQFIQSTRFEDLPRAVVEKAKICLLDTICASVLGQLCHATAIAKRTFAPRPSRGSPSGRSPRAAIWFDGRGAQPADAIFINATSASAADIDDGLDLNRGHAGSLVIPAVVAACESGGFSAKKTLAAIAVGYDLMLFASDFLLPYGKLRYPIDHGSGSMGAIAVAGALCNLHGTPPQKAAEALRIAQSYMPGGNNACAVEQCSMTKENISWGAMVGYQSFLLAQHGYTGQTSVFESSLPNGSFFEKKGARFPGLRGTYIKTYASCRFTHWPIEALCALRKRHPFSTGEIKKITVSTFRSATALKMISPTNIVSIQYSIPLCLALVLRFGELNRPELLRLWEKDAQITRLARRVVLEWDGRFEKRNDEGAGCRLTITFKNGTSISNTMTALSGDKDHQFDYEDVCRKFFANCDGVVARDRIQRIADCVASLERNPVSRLTDCLRG